MKDVGKGPWRKGPPPSVGWWPASATRRKEVLRWWDGSGWSWSASERDTAEEAAYSAATVEPDFSHAIAWRERADWWPERSRT